MEPENLQLIQSKFHEVLKFVLKHQQKYLANEHDLASPGYDAHVIITREPSSRVTHHSLANIVDGAVCTAPCKVLMFVFAAAYLQNWKELTA